MKPFFSICIPLTNRGRTIYNTLLSVSRQTFREFEVIIVDCGSKDNTRSEVEKFFSNYDYKNNPFKYQYTTLNYIPKTVEDWNEPILLATGKYIAMLEGDDQFLENHLQVAYNCILSHDNIGMYTTGNQLKKRFYLHGLIQPAEWIIEQFLMRETPPPSETIFIRLNRQNTPFLYNVTDYEYAPEMDLNMQIASNNFCAYFSDTQLVWRDFTPKKQNTWHFFADYYTMIKKYKHLVDRKIQITTRNMITASAIFSSLQSRKLLNIYTFAKNLIKEIGVINYLIAWLYMFIIIKNKLIKKITGK